MTQEQEDKLYAEAGRIHERARGQGRGLSFEERQRLAEISVLLRGGDESDVEQLRKVWNPQNAEAPEALPAPPAEETA